MQFIIYIFAQNIFHSNKHLASYSSHASRNACTYVCRMSKTGAWDFEVLMAVSMKTTIFTPRMCWQLLIQLPNIKFYKIRSQVVTCTWNIIHNFQRKCHHYLQLSSSTSVTKINGEKCILMSFIVFSDYH